MISTLNILNLFFPRDTKRRAAFKKLYYAIHSFLPKLSYSMKDCHAALDKFASLLKDKKAKPVVIFDHKMGGGSNIYRDDTARKLIESGNEVIMVIYHFKDQCYIIRYNGKQKSVILNKNAGILYEFLGKIEIKEIIINDLVSFPEPEKLIKLIIELKSKGNPRLTLPLHDYYLICPSYNLLDYEYKFCGIPDTGVCEHCLQSTKLEEVLYKPESIGNWRSEWEKLLSLADEITVFSKSSMNLLSRAYPSTDTSRIHLKPHKVGYINKVAPVKNTSRVIIGIPGNINLAKGSNIVKEMIDYLESEKNNKIEIIIIGNLADKYCRSKYLEITGNYRKENLGKIIESHRINVLFIPSVWPETFSFTTEEAIMTGLPVAAFNLGAPSERLANYHKAILIDKIDGAYAVNQINSYFTNIIVH